MKYYQITILLFLGVLIGACSLLGGDKKDECKDDTCGGISLPKPIYFQPYAQPSVSPDGQKLLFVRTKITNLRTSGGYTIDPDSSGIWMADIDGSDKKLLLKGQVLRSPSFSPDMQWILFEGGAQLFKMPFSTNSIDATEIVQLTNTGRNFFPTWSPNGERIVYRRSLSGESAEVQGIWVVDHEGNNNEQIFSGNTGSPTWSSDGTRIGFFRGVINTSGNVLGDKFWLYEFDNRGLTELIFLEGDNRYPKYSPDGIKIGFTSQTEGEQPQVWVMDNEGENLIQLTTDGGVEPSWTLDQKIVYVDYNYHRYEKSNGTIWIMNADGSGKQQLTYNHELELE